MTLHPFHSKAVRFMAPVLLPFALLSASLSCNNASADCYQIRAGRFHMYSEAAHKDYVVIRKGSMQLEIDLQKNDTSHWRVIWQKDCSYLLKYDSGGKTLAPEYKELLKNHNLKVQVLSLTPNYYVYELGVDGPGQFPTQVDTLWTDK